MSEIIRAIYWQKINYRAEAEWIIEHGTCEPDIYLIEAGFNKYVAASKIARFLLQSDR